MALNNVDQESIRRYLLGPLSEDEQQKIEERLMTEDDFFEELEISKDEVLEDYCSGDLTPNEKEWLEQNFLASPEGKFRKKFGQTLNRIALSSPKREIVPEPVIVPEREIVPEGEIVPEPSIVPDPKPSSLIERLKAFWNSHPWIPAAVASAAAVVIVAVLVIPSFLPKKSLALTLISSAPTRGGESPTHKKVSIPPDVDELAITLELPAPAQAGTRYRGELDDRSTTRSVEIDGADTKSVRVTIPASQLQRGRYVLKLFTTDADGVEQPIPSRYFFDVE